jgi:hypothetical protein
MSRIGLPLDDPMLQRLERSIRAVEPDPLFRRRLRGEIVNRHVATREGLVRAPRRQREMGRLGRATLYASLAVALSVTVAGAASQGALPGEALYSVKLQLEEIRMRIAPTSLQDDLAAMVLAERLEEVEALATQGAWSRVAAAADGVVAAEDRLAAFGPPSDPADAAPIHKHVAVLEALLATAPEAARHGLETALHASSKAGGAAPEEGGGGDTDQAGGSGQAGGKGPSGGSGQAGGNGPSGGNAVGHRTPDPDPSPTPGLSQHDHPSPRADHAGKGKRQ